MTSAGGNQAPNLPDHGRHAFIALTLGVVLVASADWAAGQTGALKVTSFPSGARVMIDGGDTGKNTPMSTSLSVGDHTVVVSLPNSGWNPDSRIVTIVSGNNDLSVTLLPVLTAGPPGPKGDKGDVGPQGPPGPRDTELSQLVEETLRNWSGILEGALTGMEADLADLQRELSRKVDDLSKQVADFPRGLNGMRAFTHTSINAQTISTWTPPAGVTHVMVEMWGSGGGGGGVTGGGGGGYSRHLIQVVPNEEYLIVVGRGGSAHVPFNRSAETGETSRMMRGSETLMFATGGAGGTESGAPGFAGIGDPAAVISGIGGTANAAGGAAAYGASFCPNGSLTGKGGDIFQGGQPGYVLLVW